MGGGGGVFGGGFTPDKYRDIIRETKEETRDADFNQKVNELIGDRLAESERDADLTRSRIDEITDALREDGLGTFETLFGGSVKKHTYVDGLSDVDVLLLIDKTDLTGASPDDVISYLRERLEDLELGDAVEVRSGRLAVTVVYSNGDELQLLPAIRMGEGFRIPDEAGGRWSNVVRPDKFAEKLTAVNRDSRGKVVPVVKLVKRMISQLPKSLQLSGYHVESIAIEAFEGQTESRTNKDMLLHFFETAKERVRVPIRDSTGQSIHVDDYLGSENSAQRLRVSYSLDRVARRMRRAEETKDFEEWESLIGE